MVARTRTRYPSKDVQEAWDLAQALVAENSARNRKWESLDRFYFGDEATVTTVDHSDPLGMVAGSTDSERADLGEGKAARELELGVKMVAVLDPVFTIPSSSDDTETVEAAEARERWLNTYYREQERAGRQGLLRRAAWHGFQRGMIAARVLVRKDRLQKKGGGDMEAERLWSADDGDQRLPSQRVARYQLGESFPLQIQIRDTAGIYPDWSEDGLEAVVDVSTRRVRHIRRRFPEVLEDTSDNVEVEWTEVWTRKTVYYFAGSDFVGKVPHLLGVVPYAIEYPVLADSADTGRQVRPFLEGAKRIARRLNRLLTVAEQTALEYQNDAWIVHGADEAGIESAVGGVQQHGLSLEPGAINYLYQPDARVYGLRRQTTPPDVQALIGLLLSEWEAATWPKEMHGREMLARARSGLAWGLMTEAGRLDLAPIMEALQKLLEGVGGLVLRALERELAPLVGGTVQLTAIAEKERAGGGKIRIREVMELNADEIGGDYLVECSLGQPASAEQLQKALIAERLYKVGLVSRTTAQEQYLAIQNPAEEAERLVKEQAESAPEVLQIKVAIAKARAVEQALGEARENNIPDEVLALVPELQRLLQPQEIEPEIGPAPPGPAVATGGQIGGQPPAAGEGEAARLYPPELGGDFGMYGAEGAPDWDRLEQLAGIV